MAGRTQLYGSAAAAACVNPVLIQNQRVPCSSSDPHDSIFMPASSPSFLGSRSMVSFDQDVNNGRKRMEKTFYGSFEQECDNGGVGDEDYEDYLRQPEKKRRLTVEQVQFLERSFELENKLEPERKIELAKELGLQPRQIAIWFQNRRARWKTKQLEKDYDVLQTNYDKLRSDYDNLLIEKNKLKAEVAEMTEKLLLKGKEEGEITKDPSSADDSVSEDDDHHHQESKGSEFDGLKQEDLSSAKSDVLDSDSPRCYIDGGGGGDYSSFLQENGDSSYVFEPDQSDLSQDDDEDDNISKNPALHPAAAAVGGGYFFPKIEEDGCCYTDPPSSSYFGGFTVEDQTFGFWQYN